MKTIKTIKQSVLLSLLATFGIGTTLNAQCYEPIGSAYNIFSAIPPNTSQIVVNNALNTVMFIHSNDNTVSGKQNGVFRYDISTDNGATWQLNQGNLNPGSTIPESSGQFPQAGIYNPPGNSIIVGMNKQYSI